MTQAYSNAERESDPHALPDIEVFYSDGLDWANDSGEDTRGAPGWYWWSCFPGCLPDSEPIGPFKTEAEALADAQNSD